MRACGYSAGVEIRPVLLSTCANVAAVDVLELIEDGFDEIPFAILKIEGRDRDL
jgi:hypothetical protein